MIGDVLLKVNQVSVAAKPVRGTSCIMLSFDLCHVCDYNMCMGSRGTPRVLVMQNRTHNIRTS
jgi:hypothetical protein